MRDVAVLFLPLLATVARLAGPGGARCVVAESVLVKHQLLILNRRRKRSPNLRVADRVVAGVCALLVRPGRETTKSDLGVSSDRAPDRLGLRYSPQHGWGAAHSRRSVPAGPRLGGAVLAHGPRSREGQSVESRSVSVRICRPADTLGARRDGPMHASDRGLWCPPRRCGWTGLCRMFNRATRGHTPPKYLSSDHAPLYRFHQWPANLRILDVKEIKTVRYVPLSHPFVERLIGTIRRECLDRALFWTAADLEMTLRDFQRYDNGHRTHAGLEGRTPEPSEDAGAHGRVSVRIAGSRIVGGSIRRRWRRDV
jgi:Integrase core domain